MNIQVQISWVGQSTNFPLECILYVSNIDLWKGWVFLEAAWTDLLFGKRSRKCCSLYLDQNEVQIKVLHFPNPCTIRYKMKSNPRDSVIEWNTVLNIIGQFDNVLSKMFHLTKQASKKALPHLHPWLHIAGTRMLYLWLVMISRGSPMQDTLTCIGLGGLCHGSLTSTNVNWIMWYSNRGKQNMSE